MIIGIDLDSKRLAYMALEEDTPPRGGTIPRANTHGRIHTEYDAALTRLMRRAGETGAVVFLEDIYLPRERSTANVRGFKALAHVQGEVRRAARQSAVPVMDCPPSTWHSSVLGFTKGRDALKAAALAKAREIDPQRAWTEHEADALCIALHGFREQNHAEGSCGAHAGHEAPAQ